MKEIKTISVASLICKSDRINKGDLKALAENIKVYGLKNPLLIISNNGQHEIVDGRRRFEACKLAGLQSVPCIEVTKDELTEDLPLILNTHRLNHNAVELYRLAARYVRKELKGDPMMLPPDKIKAVAAKLNLDVPATCRILNIGRLSKDVRDHIASGKLPIRLAFLVLRIPNKKDQEEFCKFCIEERPSMREALETLSHQRKRAPDRDLDDALFNTDVCQSCRHRGHQDRSLFEEPVSEDDDENFADSCWNVQCFDKKTDEAWKAAMKEAKEKLGLQGIKKTDGLVGGVKYGKIVATDPKICKTCKQVKLTSACYEGIFVSCPASCANIKQTKKSKAQEKPKKKDPAKFNKEDKINVLNERFAVAARKVMVEYFFATIEQKTTSSNQLLLAKRKFKKSRLPKNYKRILFFIGCDANNNPFGDFAYLDPFFKEDKTKVKVVTNLDLKKVAEFNIDAAADHLWRYDRSNITPEQIDEAIALLYGESNWCATHYKEIVEKLSKRSKTFLKDIKPWKPAWTKKRKKK